MNECRIDNHIPTDDGEGCTCGYFIQRKVSSKTRKPKLFAELNSKHQEIYRCFLMRQKHKVTIRDIMKSTTLESIGSVQFGIKTLINNGFIKQVSRSEYEVVSPLPTSSEPTRPPLEVSTEGRGETYNPQLTVDGATLQGSGL